jgi:hypothetical protein
LVNKYDICNKLYIFHPKTIETVENGVALELTPENVTNDLIYGDPIIVNHLDQIGYSIY